MQTIEMQITNTIVETYNEMLAAYRGNEELIAVGQVEFNNGYHEIFDNFVQFMEMVALYDTMSMARDVGLIESGEHAFEIIKACHPHRAPEITTELMFVYATEYEHRTQQALAEIEQLANEFFANMSAGANTTIH